MNRRSFIAGLLALPLVRRLAPKPTEAIVACEVCGLEGKWTVIRVTRPPQWFGREVVYEKHAYCAKHTPVEDLLGFPQTFSTEPRAQTGEWMKIEHRNR